jgi:hypothetical protein
VYVCSFDPDVYNGQYVLSNNNGITRYTKNVSGPNDQIIIEYNNLYESWAIYTTLSYASEEPYFTSSSLINIFWDITQYTPNNVSSVGSTYDSDCTPPASTFTPVGYPTPTPTPTSLISVDFDAVSLSLNNNKSMISSNGGSSWTTNDLPSSALWSSVAKGYTNNIASKSYVGCAYNNSTFARSLNGSSWSSINLTSFNITDTLWNKIYFAKSYNNLGDDYFIALSHGSNGGAKSSDAGSTWSRVILPSYGNWDDIAYGNGLFVAVSLSLTYATSANALTWTQRTLPVTANTMSNMTFINGQFIIVLKNRNYLLVSSDGINWTQKTLPTYSNWSGIAYNNNKYVLVSLSSESYLLTSTDLNSWTTIPVPAASYQDIIYEDNNFISVSNGSIVIVSPDGNTWTQRSSPNANWICLT